MELLSREELERRRAGLIAALELIMVSDTDAILAELDDIEWLLGDRDD